MPNNIVSINNELYNYLNDVNYGMSKPQFNHLTTIVNGLINLPGTKTLSEIAENVYSAKDKSCICKFLSSSRWDDNLLNRNRINYLNFFLENNIAPESVGFLVIDDTVNSKESAKRMQGLSYNYSHTESKNVWSHCVVTSNFVTADKSIPLEYQPYYKEEFCNRVKKDFKSKVDIAKDFIISFKSPSNCKKVYCLMDSWYTSNNLIETALLKGYHLIGAIKSNRKISPLGISLQLSEFEKYIDPNTLDLVTVKGKNYKIYTYEGNVAKFPNAKVLICYEVSKDGFESPVYLMSTDISLDSETILEYYLHRWSIETSYKYFKGNLGFDKYRIRSIVSIERYFLIVFLAYNFLELFRITVSHKTLNTIGKVQKHLNNLMIKSFVCFIYEKSKQNVNLEDILIELKIA
ncbi:IS701 family transposase [uncultured Clostridium sp.]|uniref:IS701 family transposase n=1 Tax=uncultured Clostridium sp. TaxID=59620 RepID=UPI0025D5E7EB|nr:IS701 family transposase [uncultured Clostridium sp.]